MPASSWFVAAIAVLRGLPTVTARWIAPAQVGDLSSAQVELGVFFLIGLLGGAHCLGMCGPLVTMYAERLGAGSDRREDLLTLYEVRQHALFNLGRTVSYATLGGVFGLAGALFFDASGAVTTVATSVRAVAGILVGLFIVAVGVRYTLGHQGNHGIGGGALGGLYGRAAAHIEEWVTGPGIVGLGLVHGLLPCPLLYPAFLYAFVRGSPLGGVLALGALGVGTFPTLFLYGTVVGSVDASSRARIHRLLGVAFLFLGWIPLSHGLSLAGVPVPHLELPIYQPLVP